MWQKAFPLILRLILMIFFFFFQLKPLLYFIQSFASSTIFLIVMKKESAEPEKKLNPIKRLGFPLQISQPTESWRSGIYTFKTRFYLHLIFFLFFFSPHNTFHRIHSFILCFSELGALNCSYTRGSLRDREGKGVNIGLCLNLNLSKF